MEESDWIAIFALLFAVLGFVVGLFQYRKAQRWKIAEFVANEFKEFENDPVVADAMLILDWNPIKTPLAIMAETGRKLSEYPINHNDLEESLRHHGDVPQGFSEKQSILRQTFDHFFAKLGRFEHYIDAVLINKSDLDPYITYWMDALCGNGQILSRETCQKIWKFLKDYDYDDVVMLLSRSGCRFA